MQDRPDLIQSELSGLAFDSLQQAFRAADIDRMMVANGMPAVHMEPIYIFIDPAAGGPHSDYCVLSLTRQRGIITVSLLFSIILRVQIERFNTSDKVRGREQLILQPLRDGGSRQICEKPFCFLRVNRFQTAQNSSSATECLLVCQQ